MKTNILLVEDSEEYQKVVTRALSNHQVICAASVDEAFEKLGQKDFDLVLLDIGLPKKPGFQLLSEIQGHPNYSHIPILCLTGKTELSDKVTAFSLGADDYILKPFDPIELKARVESRITKKRRNAEASTLLIAGNIEIDLSSHRVRIAEQDSKSEVELVLLHGEMTLRSRAS